MDDVPTGVSGVIFHNTRECSVYFTLQPRNKTDLRPKLKGYGDNIEKVLQQLYVS